MKSHYDQVIVATNQEMSYSKLVLNLLNTLSFWWAFRLMNAPLYALTFRRLLGRVSLKVAGVLRTRKKKTNRVVSSDWPNEIL